MKEPFSVLHVLWGLHAAGIENLALQLVKHKPENVECDLLNLDPEALDMVSGFDELVSSSLLRRIYSFRGKSLRLLWLSMRLVSKLKPSSVIIYPCDIRLVWVVLGVHLAGVHNISICVQNSAPKARKHRQKWKKLLQILLFLRVDLISCSEAVADSIRPLLPGAKYLPVIYNGCDLDGVSRRANYVKSSSASTGRYRVGMVARLDRIKDQASLIHAFALCENSSWDLVLIGDGPQRKYLEELCYRCGLNPSTIFLGQRLDIPEILGSLDLFAFSTTPAEGFGIVLIEAMAAGLPVVASDVPACREVLADGAAGLLVSAGDVEAWTTALQKLMAQTKTRERLAEAAVERAKTYGIEACASRWYQKLTR